MRPHLQGPVVSQGAYSGAGRRQWHKIGMIGPCIIHNTEIMPPPSSIPLRKEPPMECPASMCPLVAPNGSPWTGEYGGPCPGHDDLDAGGCPWWSMACATGGIQKLVEEAAQCGGCSSMPIVGPNKPRRHEVGASKEYDCPKAPVCRWQERATIEGRTLCPPRDALARGIDPRVCVF